jgi:hypothetical protein
MINKGAVQNKEIKTEKGIALRKILFVIGFILLLPMFFVNLVLAVPTVDFVSPTLNNASSTGASSVYINVSTADSTNNISTFIDRDRSLVGWWRFNNESGENSTFVRDWGNYANNGTLINGATYTPAGVLGGAMSFDGSNDYVNLTSQPVLQNDSNFSIFFWVNPSNTAGPEQHFASILGRPTNWDLQFYKPNAANSLTFLIYSGGHKCLGGAVTVNNVFTNGQWVNIGYTRLANYSTTYSNYTIYKNGVPATSVLCNGSINTIFYIGKHSSYYFNGSMDDVLIFNRSLSSNEILALYANQTTKYLEKNFTELANGAHTFKAYTQDSVGNVNSTSLKTITVDTTNPNASLLTPANNTYRDNTSQNLTANLSDNLGIQNATLWVYNSTGLFNSTTFEFAAGTTTAVVGTVQTLIDGIYTWWTSVLDKAGNTFTSGNNTLNVDATYPLINFTSPTPENNSGKRGVFYINVTIEETNTANISITFDNTLEALCNRTNVNPVFSCNNSNATVYNISLSNYIFLFNRTGLVAGINYYYNVTITDFAGNTNTTETRLVKGNSPPSLISLTQTPNTNDSLDPQTLVVITANITDAQNNMDSAVLEWINSSQTWSEANRTVMENLSSKSEVYILFNSSFVLPNYEGEVYYRIFVNDTLGESTNLTNYPISNRYDCTWGITTTGTGYNLGSTGGFYQDKSLGNITIANTGDVAYSNNNCSILFARTTNGSDWYGGSSYYTGNGRYLNFSLEYYLNGGTGFTYKYNGSSVTSLRVNATETKILELFGNFPALTSVSALREYPYFTIASSINDSEDTTNNVTINSQMVLTPGAYLETGFNPSSQTVYLTAGNFSIAGYAKNLVDAIDNPQNNTAYNISFNISIPSALESLLTSEEINKSIEILNTTEKNYTNLTFTLTSANIVSLGVQNYTFYSYASGFENSTGSLSLIQHSGNNTIINNSGAITFACYSAANDSVCPTACTYLENITNYYDPDCIAPTTTTTTTTTGGSGGGGGGGASTSNIGKSEASFELLRGDKQKFDLEIKNKYYYNMSDIKIVVEGINSKYLSISPNEITQIAENNSETIKVNIEAPAYFNAKNYSLIFTITGYLNFNGTKSSFTERKYVTLYILDLPRVEADEMLKISFEIIEKMNSSEMIMKEALDLLESINKSYTNTEFNSLKESYDALSLIYKNAFDSKALLEELGKKIDESERNGIAVEQTKKLLYLAEVAYNRGEYTLAITRLKEAKLTYGLETKGEFNLFYAVKNNPIQAFGFLVLAGFVGMSGTLLFRFQLYRKRLFILKKEEVLLLELMRVVQRECFEGNKMSMEEYEQAMSQYEKRLAETIQEKISTETRLANLLKVKGKRTALDEERKLLVEMVRKLQEDYLNKAKIETRVYDNMIKSYTLRLGEVDEQLAFIDARAAIKQKKNIMRRFRI